MDTVIIEPQTKSDARLLLNFSKRIGAKVIDVEDFLEDMALGRRIEEGLKGPSVSESEVMDFLNER
jgi:hypothetical protein